MPLFALIDANNFYVSCERLFRPDLLHHPVAVLSNNDGCFISRSNEVKALGIPMGAPLFKYQQLVNQHSIHVFSSNFPLYGDISQRFMALIKELTPQREIYSIDEAFINFTGIPISYAYHIQCYLLQSLSLPTCIGIAPTKTLAKIANQLAKKFPSYGGVCLLQTPQDIQTALLSLPIENVWGVGRRLSFRLRQNGINTAYDLQQTDPRWIRQHFTVIEERLVRELRGTACFELHEQPDSKQSLQVTRSFAQDITHFEELRTLLASYAAHLGKKLRQQNLKTSHLIVTLKTNPFRTEKGNIHESFSIELPYPLSDDMHLIKATTKALNHLYHSTYPYKKAGIMALNLTDTQSHQYNLFNSPAAPSAKIEKVFQAIDQMNKKYGTGTLHMAACGQKLRWPDRKDKKSPAYTTSWKELPVAHAH